MIIPDENRRNQPASDTVILRDSLLEMEKFVDDEAHALRPGKNKDDLNEPLRGESEQVSASDEVKMSATSTSHVSASEDSGWLCSLGGICNRGIEMLKLSLPQQNSVDHDDLDRTGFMFFVAFTFRFIFIFVLLYVGITDYYSQLQNEYLSPTSSSGDCENISVSIRNEYLSDYNGHWETQREFQFTEALYLLEFKGLEVTYEQYVANMQVFQSRLRALSNTAAQRDIGYTLVALASFHMEDEGRAMEFKFNTYTPLLFDYVTGDFSIGNRNGFCVPFDKYPIYADYDKNNAAITFEVHVNDSTGTPCEQLIVHQYVNNNFAIQSDGVLPIKFDIRSIATAVAVNNGMLKVNRDLKAVYSDAYGVTAYIDPNYSDMAPLPCYPGATEADPDVCLILSPDYFFMYPSIMQMGNFADAAHCDCPIASSSRDVCETVSVIVGLLILNIDDRIQQQTATFNFTRQFVDLRKNDPANGDLAASKLFFDAHIRVHNSINTTAEDRRRAFDAICGDIPCSIFHIELYGESPFININSQGLQLSKLYADRDPSPCENALYQGTAMDPIISTPPVSLQESYFVCRPPPADAFQRALGVAAGSAELYSSIVLSIVITGFVYMYNRTHKNDQLIEPDEKKRLMEDRVRSLEYLLESVQSELAVANRNNVALQESNARIQRQFDDFAKSFIAVRNHVVELKIDVARNS
jgi:hypothetical protein